MTAPRNDPYLQPLQYAIPAAAQTAIPCTKWARRVEIWEDESGPPGGLTVTYPNGTVATYSPAQQPIILTDKAASGAGSGRFVGRPPQTDGAPLYNGDVYVTLEGVAATVVNVAEYD
jgi:hypothetical protein